MSETTDRDAQLQNILDLSSDDFRNLVRNNLGDEHPNLWTLLADPTTVRRTYATLTAIYTDVCGTIAERAAGFDAFKAECYQRGEEGRQDFFAELGPYNSWRRRTLGYRRMLGRRMGEIKQELPSAAPVPRPRPTMPPAKKVRLVDTIFRLGWAIREHRERSFDADIKPEQHDTDLWDALRAIEVQADDDVISVAELLDRIAAKPGFTPARKTAAGAATPTAETTPTT